MYYEIMGSYTSISILVPLLSPKEANKRLDEANYYLITIGENNFQSSWAEVKREGGWFTKFLFEFRERKPHLEKVLRNLLN